MPIDYTVWTVDSILSASSAQMRNKDLYSNREMSLEGKLKGGYKYCYQTHRSVLYEQTLAKRELCIFYD
jgi:hypothetical protein